MSVAHLCNKLMTVQRCSVARDGQGSVTRDWANVYVDIKCRQRRLSASERTSLGREMLLVTNRFYCDAGVDIREKDRIIFEGNTYDVDSVNNPHLLNRHLEIDTILRN